MQYFILGSHPELSHAEICSVLGFCAPPSKGSVLLLETDANLGELQERLAGTIKIGNVIGEMKTFNRKDASELIGSFASQAAGKNKISFGLSVYDAGSSSIKAIEGELSEIGKLVKKHVKETDRPVRFVSSKKSELSSVIIKTNGLLESGGEFVFLVTPDKILIGQTETVQDFKAWSKRDYDRPALDKKSGILPPKLARMMVNLAGANPASATLLDPFCGSGTILMEAGLMGFEKLIGSDISEKAIEDTTKNLKWIDVEAELHTSSAESLSEVLEEPVDAIVAETYLGPTRSTHMSAADITRMAKELLPMYEASFVTLKTLLKKDGTAVIAFPAFVLDNESVHHLPLKPMLEKIGFTVLDSFLYKRPNQFVARDIIRLRP